MNATKSPTIAVPWLPVRLEGCDRCGATAQVIVVLSSGAELMFCGHHAREHRARLHGIGAVLAPLR